MHVKSTAYSIAHVFRAKPEQKTWLVKSVLHVSCEGQFYEQCNNHHNITTTVSDDDMETSGGG